jgi:hypothetical protein
MRYRIDRQLIAKWGWLLENFTATAHSHPATLAPATVRPGHESHEWPSWWRSLRRVGGFAAKHIGRDPPIAQD